MKNKLYVCKVQDQLRKIKKKKIHFNQEYIQILRNKPRKLRYILLNQSGTIDNTTLELFTCQQIFSNFLNFRLKIVSENERGEQLFSFTFISSKKILGLYILYFGSDKKGDTAVIEVFQINYPSHCLLGLSYGHQDVLLHKT